MENTKKRTKYLICLCALFFSAQTELASQKIFEGNDFIPNNLGVQLKSDTETAVHLDRVKELGLKWVRRGFIWEAIEKTEGVYDFTRYDNFLNNCKERGLTVIGCMAFSNVIYGHAKDEPGRSAYAKFAAALAERYKDYDIVWEIWNEPNTMTFWGKHGGVGNSDRYAGEYTTLVKAVVPAMKNANPDCVILAGSVSNLWSASYNWMGYCFSNHDMLDIAWDAWSIHPYGLKSPEDYLEAYPISRKLMEDAGGDKSKRPWINSERGFTLSESGSQEMQSALIVRQYLIDMLEGLPLTIWYEWGGTEGFAMYPSSIDVCKVFIDELTGYRFDKRISTERDRDFVLQFINEKGAVKWIAWTAPDANQKQNTIVPHTISVAVETTKSSLPLTDLYGVKSSLEVTDDMIDIDLSGSPVYIELEESATVSVAEIPTTEIRVFPNPVIDNLRISSNTEMAEITLFDAFGKTVYSNGECSKNAVINMQDLPSGIYILHVSDKDNNCIKKEKIIK